MEAIHVELCYVQPYLSYEGGIVVMLEVARQDAAGKLANIPNFELSTILRPANCSFVFRFLSQGWRYFEHIVRFG